mmetsp:Transcript_24722/g.50725  ORF Transcript_24722/g.50725 Transcript_24722/m.50725 type:complete len:545 (+) Transcript_24722:218-1852(+)
MDHVQYSPYDAPHPHPSAAPSATGTGGTSVTESITNPRTMSALLAEEYTMNPSTPLPSFLEMNLVDGTADSGRRALGQCLDAVAARCSAMAAVSATAPSDVAGNNSGVIAPSQQQQQQQQQSMVSAWKIRLATLIARTCKQYSPEIILLITYAVQRVSMSKSSALAEESVYGMKRTRARYERGQDGTGASMRLSPLTEADRVRCALVAALLPYLKERLGWYYKRNKDRATIVTSSPADSTGSIDRGVNAQMDRIRTKVKAIFLKLYPYLQMTTDGASLAYQFLFLAGMTGYYSPSMHVLGVLARRVTRADFQEAEREKQQRQLAAKPAMNRGKGSGSTPPSSSGSVSNVNAAVMAGLQSGRADGAVRAIRTAILVGGSTMLITAWISHFREELRTRRRRWITGEDEARQGENGGSTHTEAAGTSISSGNRRSSVWSPQTFPIPPPYPPKLLDESESEVIRKGLPTDKSLCPICHRTRVNPAASTSGYVFCYRCIVMHIRTNGETCPLTGMHCPESRVVRLFEPTAAAEGPDLRDGQISGQGTSS